MHSGSSGTPSKPIAPDLRLKSLSDSRLSRHCIPESDDSQSKPQSRNPEWDRQGPERIYSQVTQIPRWLGSRNLFVLWCLSGDVPESGSTGPGTAAATAPAATA